MSQNTAYKSRMGTDSTITFNNELDNCLEVGNITNQWEKKR